jgi:hypothetical protein
MQYNDKCMNASIIILSQLISKCIHMSSLPIIKLEHLLILDVIIHVNREAQVHVSNSWKYVFM